jgi:predicted ATP-binding protein involved in virulence
MKLEKMRLINFRCFADIEINFHPRLNVFIGGNGAGKTAVLDAIALGFGRYLTKLPGIKGLASKETDLRVLTKERKASFFYGKWNAVSDASSQQELIIWQGMRLRDSVVTRKAIFEKLPLDLQEGFNDKTRNLDAFTNRLIEAELGSGDANFFLPVIAYYGTNRAIREEVKRRRGFKKEFLRFQALSGALDPDSHFQSAFEWFNGMEDSERREQVSRKDFEYRIPELEYVRQSITRMLGKEFSNPRTETRPLRFVVDRITNDGSSQTLRISQLSDGYRIMLGVVMDFARRLAQANPQTEVNLTNPLDLPGIVLIDEIDLHLHPSWQQHVIHDLMETFPNTQFILTTHSPQVLSTIRREHIQIIGEDIEGNLITSPPMIETYGEQSGDVLLGAMSVKPTPDIAETTNLNRLTALVDQGHGESTEARQLLGSLSHPDALGTQHSKLQQLKRTIERKKVLRSLGA